MLMKLHFIANWLWRHHVPVLPAILSYIIRIVFAAHIPASVTFGKDVQLSYSGLGTVIHHRAIIGNRVVILAGTVIGGRSGHEDVPVIEDDVLIGVGAKLLGPIRIGKGAIVGANAVVLKDVPAGATVAGVPAKIIRVAAPVARLESSADSERSGRPATGRATPASGAHDEEEQAA